jgi:hypothetical protein
VIDKRREWAATAACQIVNTCLGQDAPRHIIYADIERILSALLLVALADMRAAMLRESDN